MIIKLFDKQAIKQAIASDTFIQQFADKLESFVSIAKDSIPKAGSHTAPLDKLDIDQLFIYMDDIQMHNTGDFTVFTSICNVRFWATEDAKLLWLAHNTKKHTMNKMVNAKYDCGDLYK